VVGEKHIVRLFTRMLHLYAQKWSSVYGVATKADGSLTAAARQWLYDLRTLSPQQVAFGLNAVFEKRLEWPPGPIDFMNLCEGVPTLGEVLDRANDYGPVCKAIRAKMNFFNLDELPSTKMRAAAATQLEQAVVTLRRSGALQIATKAMLSSLPAPATTTAVAGPAE
jgi:hypothetical protein